MISIQLEFASTAARFIGEAPGTEIKLELFFRKQISLPHPSLKAMQMKTNERGNMRCQKFPVIFIYLHYLYLYFAQEFVSYM